jgi:hypothetical protein
MWSIPWRSQHQGVEHACSSRNHMKAVDDCAPRGAINTTALWQACGQQACPSSCTVGCCIMAVTNMHTLLNTAKHY